MVTADDDDNNENSRGIEYGFRINNNGDLFTSGTISSSQLKDGLTFNGPQSCTGDYWYQWPQYPGYTWYYPTAPVAISKPTVEDLAKLGSVRSIEFNEDGSIAAVDFYEPNK